MAYGSSELDVAATTVDLWINEGTNGIDLLASHCPELAILFDNSQEPGGDYQFQQSDVAEGNQFKVTVFGKANTSADGVTRANQINRITAAVTTNLATNALWPWTHYQGLAQDNYEDRVKNSGKSQMVNLTGMILDQIQGSFFETLSTDLWDAATGAIDKIEAINYGLKDSATSTVGGIDKSDSNNSWWRPQVDTTTEVFNTQTFDQVRDAAYFDTGRRTGIRKPDPDLAFFYGNLYAKLRQDLKPSQRTDVTDMLRGGAKYLMYDGVRCFRTTKSTSGTVVILNSSTMVFRYATKMPDPVTPGWVPVSGTPGMFERGYNWFIGFGYTSLKHNGYMSNKSA